MCVPRRFIDKYPRYTNQIQLLSMSPTLICALGLSFVFVLYFHSFPFVFPIFPLGIGLSTKLSVQVCGVLGLAHQNVQNDQTEYNNNNNNNNNL